MPWLSPFKTVMERLLLRIWFNGATIGDKSVATLGSKIRFTSVLEHFTPLPPLPEKKCWFTIIRALFSIFLSKHGKRLITATGKPISSRYHLLRGCQIGSLNFLSTFTVKQTCFQRTDLYYIGMDTNIKPSQTPLTFFSNAGLELSRIC